MKNKAYYYLKIDLEGPCGAIAGLNQAPHFVKHAPDGGGVNMPVNEFMLIEGNKLTGYLFWPPGVPYEEGKTRFMAIVYEADPAKSAPEPGRILASHQFPVEGKPEAYPHSFEVQVELGPQDSLLDLSEAKKMTALNRDDLQEIALRINSYINALLANNFDEAWKITRRRWNAIETTNGYDKGTGENLLRQQIATLQRRSQGREWQVDFDLDEIVARPCYDHQLFWICATRNQRGAFTLFIPNPEDPKKFDRSFSMPLYAGKTAEGWEIFL